MAPYLAAVCTLLCLGTSTAFVAPTVSCSSRGITAHRRTCAATAASAGPASRPRRNSLPPLFMADGEVDEEILGKVQEIVAQQLAVEAAQVVPAASFTQDLGADSLDTVELIMALEEGFDIEIEDESAAEIMTVKDAVDFISKSTK